MTAAPARPQVSDPDEFSAPTGGDPLTVFTTWNPVGTSAIDLTATIPAGCLVLWDEIGLAGPLAEARRAIALEWTNLAPRIKSQSPYLHDLYSDAAVSERLSRRMSGWLDVGAS